MVVLLVDLQVLGEVVDPLREECDLDLGRPGVGLVALVRLDGGLLVRQRAPLSFSTTSLREVAPAGWGSITPQPEPRRTPEGYQGSRSERQPVRRHGPPRSLVASAVVFTGIVEELGRFEGRTGDRLRFAATTVLEGAGLGDSIAVNGCCLTLVEQRRRLVGGRRERRDPRAHQPRRRSRPGDPVNLERPVRLEDRLGGHIVLGHVDGVGEVVAPAPDLVVRVPAHLMRYLVEKGSVAVDGISLTAFGLTDDTLHGRHHPPHRRGHHPRDRGRRGAPSTSRSTCWPSTWSGCSRPTSRDGARVTATGPVEGKPAEPEGVDATPTVELHGVIKRFGRRGGA